MAEHHEIAALLDRLRTAIGPDRQIDGDIDAMFRIGRPDLPAWAMANFPVWKSIGSGRVAVLHDNGDHGLHWASSEVTASIEAALRAVDHLLPEMFWSVGFAPDAGDDDCEDRCACALNLYQHVADRSDVVEHHKTHPLAVLTAMFSVLAARAT